MTRVFKAQELKVVADDKPGTLARVTAPIAEARININAFCAYRSGGGKAEFLFLTANNAKATDCWKKAGFRAQSRDVVVVETTNESGTLYHAAQQLAQAGVDLDYCYATAGTLPGSTWVVFGTPTVEKALNVIP